MKIFRYNTITRTANSSQSEAYFFSQKPRFVLSAHRHAAWEIIRIVSGNFNIAIPNHISAQAGDILFLSEGLLHSDLPSDCTYESLTFRMQDIVGVSENMRELLRPLYQVDIIPQEHYPAGSDPVVTSIVDEVMTAGTLAKKSPKSDNNYALEIFGCVCRFFSYILTNGYYISAASKSIQKNYRQKQFKDVIRYIEQNYPTNITLEDLAQIADMNPNYFCKFFRKITGKTPVDYVLHYRIDQSCQLLTGTKLSVADIAFKCGFTDQSYFTKQFKRVKGITPSQYRKAQK